MAVLLSAAAVALIALAAAVLAFFIGNGQAPTVFGQVFGHFALAATLTWVLLVVANALGATRVWFLALLAGFASSCLAALIATTVHGGRHVAQPVLGGVVRVRGQLAREPQPDLHHRGDHRRDLHRADA